MKCAGNAQEVPLPNYSVLPSTFSHILLHCREFTISIASLRQINNVCKPSLHKDDLRDLAPLLIRKFCCVTLRLLYFKFMCLICISRIRGLYLTVHSSFKSGTYPLIWLISVLGPTQNAIDIPSIKSCFFFFILFVIANPVQKGFIPKSPFAL